MDRALDRILSVVMILGTLVIGGGFVYRWLGSGDTSTDGLEEAPVFEESWRAALEYGKTIAGPENARVTVIEFTDLECPACSAYQPGLQEVIGRHPQEVRLVYVPFPLSIHRFAKGAARAADCVIEREPAMLPAWIATMFDGQDSLGLKSWGHFAQTAGITDTAYVAHCATDPTPSPRVEASIAYGEQLGVRGTPSLMINGWRYQGLPSTGQLERFIQRVLDESAGVSMIV